MNTLVCVSTEINMVLFIRGLLSILRCARSENNSSETFTKRFRARRLKHTGPHLFGYLLAAIRERLYPPPTDSCETRSLSRRDLNSMQPPRKQTRGHSLRPLGSQWSRSLVFSWPRESERKIRRWIRYRLRLPDVFMNIGTLASERASRAGAHKGGVPT